METNQHFKYCKIDPTNATKDDLIAEINRLTNLMNQKKNEEQAIKIFINSIYGATASPYFVGYNVRVAEAITLQGQEVRDYAGKIFNRYFMEFWHRDKELHEKIGITRAERVTQEVSIYGDTDTIFAESIINTRNGDYTIADVYKKELIKSSFVEVSPHGHEVIEPTNLEILNFKDNEIKFSRVKRLIRHRSSKEKWHIKTKSGKEIFVTNDHSMIVFRNGIKLKTKAKDILKTDKILCVKKDVSP